MDLLVAVVWGALGVGLLVWGAERLVTGVRARATLIGASALVIGLLATSADVESTAAGLAAAHKGLESVAVGISLGSVVFLVTVALGVAALLFPFSVRTPSYFLLAMAGSAGAAGLVLLDGRLGRVEAAFLVALFAGLLVGTRRHLPGMGEPVEGTNAEPAGSTLVRTRTRFVLTVGTSLLMMAIGAELLAEGAHRAVAASHQSETFIGMVVVAVALSLEEGLLEVLPTYRGVPEIAVGNVIGTTVFLLTASLGVVGVVHPLRVRPEVVTFHVPAMLGAVALCTWALTRNRTGRREGAVLVAYYVAYLIASAVLA
ncbi:MAG: sodium:calcium antiporter [Actinomycetota bacterium]